MNLLGSYISFVPIFQNGKSKKKKKFQKWKKIIQQYNENTITRAEYVKMMSHYYADSL
jgi:formyltetrahydrofolate hydrolase